MNNRLFCTFSTGDLIETVLDNVKTQYQVLYGKIFILETSEEDSYVLTYNLDMSNLSIFPKDTILVHRSKPSRTLYTINALNTLIQSLNNGNLDKTYRLDWNKYRDCILLTRESEFCKIGTKLYGIQEI